MFGYFGQLRKRSQYKYGVPSTFPGGTIRTIRNRPRQFVPPALNILELPESRVAIVIQGPVVNDGNFTRDTVSRYRRIFPNASIILSTWTGLPEPIANGFRNLGAHVILSSPPERAGNQNVNFQMASTHAGIKLALELGCTHVLKTRTDQRIYAAYALDFCLEMQKLFSLPKTDGGSQGRILCLGMNSFIFRLYGVSDMLQFGTIQDMACYWDGNQDSRDLVSASRSLSLVDYAKLRLAETYFCAAYLEKCGWDLKWTHRDSLDAIASKFLIIDTSSVDLYWSKYSRLEERWKSINAGLAFTEFDFATWLLNLDGRLKEDEDFVSRPGDMD